MTENNANKNATKVVLISLVAALAIVSLLLVWMNLQQKTEMKEMVELMEFEKEQLEDEYEELAIQFDGYQTPDIHNDSLVELLSQEKQRVQDLLEELRITKVTNARRIAELKKELATVRQVMVSYVHQIDSLDRTNKRLVAENQQVKQQYQEVARQAKQLEKERTQLAEVVSRASMLEINHFQMTPLNKRDRKTSIYNQIQKLQFDYTVGRNITNKPGMKTIYMRITRPDGEIMQKNINDVFRFENSDVAYSVSNDFEYAGEEISGSLYWQVEEILQVGWYNADFFVDGELIGSFPFQIKH
jgi:predicted  nucleic acid-binding Zn-ribbon protein